jgi:biopolymer transport protein ExbD
MSMNGQNNLGQDEIVSDINMTPLIDVMLVLLIIFMVSSSAAIESGLNVDLPQGSTVSEVPSTSLIISLTKKGEIAVAGDVVTMDQLKARVIKGLADQKTTTVVLEGDGESSLTNAFDVMNVAREAGAKELAIGAKAKGPN